MNNSNFDIDILWHILKLFFIQKGLVDQQINSFNNFIQNTMQDIIDDMPPITVYIDNDPGNDDLLSKIRMVIRLGQLHLSKPTYIEDDGLVHNLVPNEARLRNLTYSSPLYCEISTSIIKNEKSIDYILKQFSEKILIGRIPIMIKSKFCILSNLDIKCLKNLGECPDDPGGYFIVNGSEKVIVAQEQLSWNKVYIFQKNENLRNTIKIKNYTVEGYLYFAECRSVADYSKWSPSLLTVKVCLCPYKDQKFSIFKKNLKFNSPEIFLSGGFYLRMMLPYFKKDIPITWIFKALGFENEIEILDYICYDSQDEDLISIVRYIVEDDKISTQNSLSISCPILDQETALAAIGQHVSKGPQGIRIKFAYEVLQKEFLPHIGIGQGFELRKGYFFGYIINKLISTQIGKRKMDDRDHYGYKRLDTVGPLLSQLFRQLLGKVLKEFKTNVQKKIHRLDKKFELKDFFKSNYVTTGIQYALSTGNWGTDKQSLRTGISQVLNRLSYSSTLSHLRRVNSPSAKGNKITKPRHLHNSHWGYICPVETPEGHSCGLVKNLALTAMITIGTSPLFIIEKLENLGLESLEEYNSDKLKSSFKVFVNGCWIGTHKNPFALISKMKIYRRRNIFSEEISIILDDYDKEIKIFSDSGRVIRPLLIINEENIIKINNKQKYLHNLTDDQSIYSNFQQLLEEGILEYVDPEEEETCLISMFYNFKYLKNLHTQKIKYTHCELHPSVILGVCASLIPFCDHNQSPRNTYQAAMGKQAIGINVSNYDFRMDTMCHILYYPQKPLVCTKSMNFIKFKDFPNGINAIVAIACYGGYNQEDSIIMSQDSIDRGLFRSFFFRNYKDVEKIKFGGKKETFEIPNWKSCNGIKIHSYEKLDLDGLIGEGKKVNSNDIIIGKTCPTNLFDNNNEDLRLLGKNLKIKTDCSSSIKNFETGVVDKVILAKSDEGFRLVKIRIRSVRLPQIGDKFASRHGQKGIIGMIYRQVNMPFSEQGISPDIIMNPHAIPSRMTIGHLLECLLSKAVSMKGIEGDGTPFERQNMEDIMNFLEKNNFDKNGWEILYNGFNGKRIKSLIFMGPTYYQKLKHMVEDKIHSRARGPIQILTRQPVEGRSREGGLRFGEMERDCMISHGAAIFLKDRLFDQSDPFGIYVCDFCGFIVVSNKKQNNFECRNCSNRSMISFIRIPYAFKLLIQELMSLSVGVRLIPGEF
ncbi:DNA-directed RNA polymerase II second largest subunit (nucleomorph) [Guillardia theta]|uniref:DNA-directed RNA polymerase subunit beta n=1 Tax=Guillardia theta TaxID=55529 RepID=Q98RY5_GUITH|nr:DNA-directed RNA polymerase II second largest subunit [Guillardia theta]AAK39815.1 DNA-directed RNA polymerase II second largest subunit [Guillardia theta]|mmetsp:Transcript_25251/g.83439  ORF Transcript_25251/g.83439 Transcript_25251/m.83439 type:complete len:1207 (+) Transcript_25251:262-3882(+)